jgi:hypothetical protein
MAAIVRVRMRNPKTVSGADAAKPLVVIHLQGSGFVNQKLSSVKLVNLAGAPDLVARLHAFNGGTIGRITVRLKGHAPAQAASQSLSGASMAEEVNPVPDDLAITIDNPAPTDPPPDTIPVDLVGADPCSSPE